MFNVAQSNPPQIRVARPLNVNATQPQRHNQLLSKHRNSSRTSLPDLQTITQQPIPAVNQHQASHSIIIANPRYDQRLSTQSNLMPHGMKLKTASNYKLLQHRPPQLQPQRYIMVKAQQQQQQQRSHNHLNVDSSLKTIGIASIPASPPDIKEITPSPSPQPQPQHLPNKPVPKQFMYESPQRSVNSIKVPFEVAENGRIVMSSPIPNEQIEAIDHISSSSSSDNVHGTQSSPIMKEATDVKVIGRRELKKEIKRKSLKMQRQFSVFSAICVDAYVS